MPDIPAIEVHFTLHCFDPPMQITPEHLSRFASDIGLQAVASGRISSLLLTQVISYVHRYGIEPERFVAEIKHLKGISGYERSLTKPGTRFSLDGSLAGLHHKRKLPCQVDSPEVETSWLNTLGLNTAGGTLPRESCGRYSL